LKKLNKLMAIVSVKTKFLPDSAGGPPTPSDATKHGKGYKKAIALDA